MAIKTYSQNATLFRSNFAKILLSSGFNFDREKVLEFVDFPIIQGINVGGTFKRVKLLENEFPNVGAGVVIGRQKKRDIQQIFTQDKKDTRCEILYDGYYPFEVVERMDDRESDYIIDSEDPETVYVNYIKQGDITRVWFDGIVYYSNRDNPDDPPYGTYGFRLNEFHAPFFDYLPAKIEVEYTFGDWIRNPNQQYDGYLNYEISFITFSNWSPLLTLICRMYFQGCWEADKVTNIATFKWNAGTMNYDLTGIRGGIGGDGGSPVYMSSARTVIENGDLFDNEKELVAEKETITYTGVDLKYPMKWFLP